MSIERFNKQDFERALTEMSKSSSQLWERVGFHSGELCYTIAVMDRGKPTNKRVFVRSSIDGSMLASEISENSIRVWAEYSFRDTWHPLAKVKQQHHVKRTKNWRANLCKWIAETYKTALEDSRARERGILDAINKSPVTTTAALTPSTVTTATQRTGHRRTTTLKPKTITVDGVQIEIPTCSNGHEMRLRTAKRGRNAGSRFWGCSRYPRCKETRNFVEQSDTSNEQSQPESEIVPSKYQSAFGNQVTNGKGNIVLIAGPGTGKSTTALWALGLLPRELKVAYLAFGRDIVRDFAKRAPSHVRVSTLNSLGNGNILNSSIRLGESKPRFNARKVYDILAELVENKALTADEQLTIETNASAIVRLVDLLKANLADPIAENITELADKHTIELNGNAAMITEYTIATFGASIKERNSYDYSDQIYFSAMGFVKCETFDALVVDEAQDMTKAQTVMALNSLKPSGRLFSVGDPMQAIFGFRGADTKSIETIIKLADAKTMPLMLTYRMPKSHVEFVNAKFDTELETPADAIEGILQYKSKSEMRHMWQDGDMILCRCNAPLVKPAFSLIREGRKAIILGRDIGEGLVALIRKIRRRSGARTLSELLHEMDKYCIEQVRKLEKQGKTARAESLDDKCKTIDAIAEEDCETVADLETKILAVFSDDSIGTVFSTVHKCKGKQAPRVFILEAQLMPHPKASSDWELEQEQHIEFVALTRSQGEMYIHSK